MPRYRVPVTVVAVVATACLSMGVAHAAAPPDYQDRQMVEQELAEPQLSSLPDAVPGEHAAAYLERLAREQAGALTGPQVSSYPAGAGGTSNGERSAAELGEPVGAGGTSGGSISPFAVASKR